jgi:hypothetical protein
MGEVLAIAAVIYSGVGLAFFLVVNDDLSRRGKTTMGIPWKQQLTLIALGGPVTAVVRVVLYAGQHFPARWSPITLITKLTHWVSGSHGETDQN